jgi:hypothetical protein
MTDQTTPQTAKKKLSNTQIALLVGGGLLLAYALYRAHKDNAAQTQTASSGTTAGSAVGSESNPYFGDETDDLSSGGGGGGGSLPDTGDDTYQPPDTPHSTGTTAGSAVGSVGDETDDLSSGGGGGGGSLPDTGDDTYQTPDTPPDNTPPVNPALANLPTAPEIATAEAVNVGTGAEGSVATSPGAVTTFSSSAPATVVVGGEPTAGDIAAAEGYATPSKKAASQAAKTISSSAPATVVVGGEPTAGDIAAAEGYATPSKKAASHAAKTIPVQVRK